MFSKLLWQQLIDIGFGFVELFQVVYYIFEDVEVVGFCCFDDVVEDGVGIGIGCGLVEQLVFFVYDEWFNGVFCVVVVDGEMVIECVMNQFMLLVEVVLYCFVEFCFW